MAIEAQRVASLVWDLLKADTGAGGVNTLVSGRIYRDRVPQAAALPAVTVALVSSVPTNTIGGRRVVQNVLVDVRVVSDGTTYANAIADRVDTVLQNTGGLKESVHVVELVQDAVQAYIEDDAGKSYAHIVATYRTPAYV
jgi:hypothetical protein